MKSFILVKCKIFNNIYIAIKFDEINRLRIDDDYGRSVAVSNLQLKKKKQLTNIVNMTSSNRKKSAREHNQTLHKLHSESRPKSSFHYNINSVRRFGMGSSMMSH